MFRPQVGFLLLEVMVRGRGLDFRALDSLGFRDSEGRVAEVERLSTLFRVFE